MARITSLKSSKRTPSKVVIQVDGRSVATLSSKQAQALGIEIDGQWSPDLAARVADAVAYEEAIDQSMRMINRQRMTRAKLSCKLQERGHSAAMIQRVTTKLIAIGAINDETLARDLIEEIDRTRPAGPALKRAKLAQRGIDEEVIDKLVEATSAPSTQLADARKLIASKSKSMARLDETARKRKLWSLLAGRGFDEDTIATVLEDTFSD